MIHIEHEQNSAGRDFFVGDLHGCFDQLLNDLNGVDFDREKDRLFAMGDLIDRGQYSLACLRLIKEPWFFSVLGNHEQMLLDVIESDGAALESTREIHVNNGGGWATTLTATEESECLELIKRLPMARTLQTSGGKIGIVHAGWGWHWDELAQATELTQYQEHFATWIRLHHPRFSDRVEGIDAVISGHQNVRAIQTRGNQLWIDTIGKTGLLTLLEAERVWDLVY